jgi:hypothetical protein
MQQLRDDHKRLVDLMLANKRPWSLTHLESKIMKETAFLYGMLDRQVECDAAYDHARYGTEEVRTAKANLREINHRIFAHLEAGLASIEEATNAMSY